MQIIAKAFKLIYIGIPLIVLIAGYSVVDAQVSKQVTVTATVPELPPIEEPDTIVVFRGIAYPSSTVTISQDDALVSLITTNSQAQFEVSLTIDPGTYTFSIVGIDQDGLEGKKSNFTLMLSEGTTTTISGIFLGPTIAVDNTSIGPGEAATLSGTTVPSSDVNVTLTSTGVGAAADNPHIAVHITSADTNGRWIQVFQADDLAVDSYQAKAQAIEPVNQAVSEYSKNVSFSVTAGEEPDQCADAVPGDINCDGYVNLVDFSIMLYYWENTNPANTRADINSDGIVNIIDFSIMLYYWTG